MSSGNKFARGSGRMQFRPPQSRGLVPLRPGPASTSKRVPFGQGKVTSGSTSAGNGGVPLSQEESFQLLSHASAAGRPFAMLIRLQPEFLEQLKQAEVEGNESSMKFGQYPGGHEIKVGMETFKFSSASEPGDLCDIYEQKKGENGENFLMESGSAWRKLSVQRILSASEKDRVKKRTEEAEQRQRLRKSILVDPSTQMVLPSAGAAEANGRKHPCKMTKEPPQKKQRKITTSPIPSAPKPRPQPISTFVAGNNRIASPASPASPMVEPLNTGMKAFNVAQSGDMHPPKGRPMPEKASMQSLNKGNSAQKDKSGGPTVPDITKTGSAANMVDLRNFLISLLQENPKGVSLKVAEKAVAEGLSGSPDRKVVEKIIKSIATYHAPGKYLLNPGVEKGNFIDHVMPSGSGKVQETAGLTNQGNEPSPVDSHRDEKRDDSDFHEELQNMLSEHSEDDSPKESSEYLKDVEITEVNKNELNVLKENVAHTPKNPSTDDSDSSSSSGSGSGSDSDSGSSGSSSSDSGSATGSDSDASSSSSGSASSMDEHVDIMSDDDADSKSDTKQKQKRESRSSIKDDGKGHEPTIPENEPRVKASSLNPSSHLSERLEELENSNSCKPDPVVTSADDIIESVFGPDEENLPVNDTEFNNSSTFRNQGKGGDLQSGKEKLGSVNFEEEKGSTSRNRSQYLESNGIEQICKRDDEPLEIDDELDVLVENITASKNGLNGSTAGNKLPVQKESQKLQSKSSGKETEESTRHGHNSDRKDWNNYPTCEDKLQHKNRSLSLDSNKVQHEESPVGARDNLQKNMKAPFEETSVKRHSIKQQPNIEGKRQVSTNMKTGENYEKHERMRTSETMMRGKSPADMGRPDRFSDQFKVSSDISDSLQVSRKKDRTYEENFSETGKSGETQYWQQKEGCDYAVNAKFDSPHMARLNKEPVKLPGSSRQSVGSVDRIRLSSEQAERPIKHVDSTKKKDSNGKGVLKETESITRASSGDNPNMLPNVEANIGDSLRSSYSYGRSIAHERGRVSSNDFELGEFREPAFDSAPTDSRKSFPREDARGKQFPEPSNRLVLPRASSSPDLESSKHSPAKAVDDPRSYANDSRNGKRRSEENESADSDRPKKRTGIIQSRQSQYGKQELALAGSAKDNHMEKKRLTNSEMQEHSAKSNKAVMDNHMRSDEEVEEAKGPGYRKQKVNRAPISNGTNKSFDKVDTVPDVTRRQTPVSSEVQGNEFFAPFEKQKPDLRGSIRSYAEYKQYYHEYKEKYRIYIKLNTLIENHRKDFEFLHKDIEHAKYKDDEKKLANVYGKVRKRFQQHHKRCKRMVRVFQILHDELKTIKDRCKEYAEKVGQG